MDTIRFFFKNREKRMWWRCLCFGVMFLCSSLFVSPLFVPRTFQMRANLSPYPTRSLTPTLVNDISAEESPSTSKTILRDKKRQTRDVDDALSKEISVEMEILWFAYGEEIPDSCKQGKALLQE